jgi:hypothetical protein
LQVIEKAEKIVVIPNLIYEYNNLNDDSLAYRYRENGFEIETMLHQNMMRFAKQYGGDIEILYANYLFGIKAKITALVHKSGLPAKCCRQKIKKWTKQESVWEMTQEYSPKGKKDKLLLRFLKHHRSFLLYWYYKIMA